MMPMLLALLAAIESGNRLPGDRFNLWLWLGMAAVGFIGFLASLLFLVFSRKQGKYERKKY